MNLKNLHVEAPGLSTTQEIPTLVVIQGPNESGKSTLLNAVDALVLGSRSPTWDRYSEGPTRVRGTFDVEGKNWYIGRDVANGKQSGVNVNESFFAVKAGDDSIWRVLGNACSFSVSDFLAKNKREQLAMISGWMPSMPGWDREGVHDNVLGLIGRTVGTIQDDMSTLLKRLDISPDIPADNTRDYVEQLIDLVRTVDLAANREALRLDKIVDEDRKRSAVPTDLPAGTVALWRDAITNIDGKLAVQREKLGEAKEAARAINAARERLNRLTIDRQRAQDAIATEEQLVAGGQNSVIADGNKLADATARAEKTLAELNAATEARTTAERKRIELEQQRDRADALTACAPLIRPELQAALASVKDVLTWGEVVKLVGQSVVDVADRLGRIDALFAEAALNADVASPLIVAIDECKREVEGLTAMQAAKQRLNDAAITNKGNHTRNLAASEKRLSDARAHLATAQRDVERLNKEIEAAQTEVEQAGTGDTSAIEQAIAALNADRAVAQKNADRLSDYDGDQAARQQHQLDLAKAKAQRTLARALGSALVVVQSRMAEAVIQPLLRTASEITRAAYGYNIELHAVDDARQLVFRARRPGSSTTIDISHASQSVRACIGIALRVAFMQIGMARSWKALLVDDFEHIDLAKRDVLIEAIVNTGVCDNIMIAAVSDGWVPDGRWPVITLGRSTTVGDECLTAK